MGFTNPFKLLLYKHIDTNVRTEDSYCGGGMCFANTLVETNAFDLAYVS